WSVDLDRRGLVGGLGDVPHRGRGHGRCASFVNWMVRCLPVSTGGRQRAAVEAVDAEVVVELQPVVQPAVIDLVQLVRQALELGEVGVAVDAGSAVGLLTEVPLGQVLDHGLGGAAAGVRGVDGVLVLLALYEDHTDERDTGQLGDRVAADAVVDLPEDVIRRGVDRSVDLFVGQGSDALGLGLGQIVGVGCFVELGAHGLGTEDDGVGHDGCAPCQGGVCAQRSAALTVGVGVPPRGPGAWTSPSSQLARVKVKKVRVSAAATRRRVISTPWSGSYQSKSSSASSRRSLSMASQSGSSSSGMCISTPSRAISCGPPVIRASSASLASSSSVTSSSSSLTVKRAVSSSSTRRIVAAGPSCSRSQVSTSAGLAKGPSANTSASKSTVNEAGSGGPAASMRS